MLDDYHNDLNGLKSKRLLKSCGLAFTPAGGLPNLTHPIEIGLVFDDSSIKIRGGRDGASIHVSWEKFQRSDEIDLGDLGDIKIVSFSEFEPFSSCIGLEVSDIFLIVDKKDKLISGLQFKFGLDCKFSIINLGDEFWLFSVPPEHVMTDFAFL